jgi:hypothetical protein
MVGPSCTVTTHVNAGPAGWKGQIAAQVLTDSKDRWPASPVSRQPVTVKPGQALAVEVKNMEAFDAQAWSPAKPVLHHLVVWLCDEKGGSIVAAREDTFGFRRLIWRDGRLLINAEMVPLFGGTELVMYNMLKLLDDEDAQFKTVQVDLFKAMHGTTFRSHQNPLPRHWLDLCDRYGILVLPEFPNFPDVQRTSGLSPYALPDYCKNLQREARGIVTSRINHPSIVGWVVSNEGSGFGDWERNNLVPYVKALDPGRLVMLSGDVTPDVADQHNFAGMWWGTFGEFQRSVAELARFYRIRPIWSQQALVRSAHCFEPVGGIPERSGRHSDGRDGGPSPRSLQHDPAVLLWCELVRQDGCADGPSRGWGRALPGLAQRAGAHGRQL